MDSTNNRIALFFVGLFLGFFSTWELKTWLPLSATILASLGLFFTGFGFAGACIGGIAAAILTPVVYIIGKMIVASLAKSDTTKNQG